MVFLYHAKMLALKSHFYHMPCLNKFIFTKCSTLQDKESNNLIIVHST